MTLETNVSTELLFSFSVGERNNSSIQGDHREISFIISWLFLNSFKNKSTDFWLLKLILLHLKVHQMSPLCTPLYVHEKASQMIFHN